MTCESLGLQGIIACVLIHVVTDAHVHAAYTKEY